MNLDKVRAALATAQKELNTVVDAEFKARRLAGLRPLTLAQNAIVLAEGHLDKATSRVKANEPEGAEPVGAKK